MRVPRCAQSRPSIRSRRDPARSVEEARRSGADRTRVGIIREMPIFILPLVAVPILLTVVPNPHSGALARDR